MQRPNTTICSIISFCLFTLFSGLSHADLTNLVSLQADGSLVFFDSSGGIADFVKQGTPRQSVLCGGQSLNVSYGSNSSGKKTILISLPKSSSSPAEFTLAEMQVMIPPGSALRLTLNSENQLDRMEGAPADTVSITKSSLNSKATPPVTAPRLREEKPVAAEAAVPPPPSQSSPLPSPPSQPHIPAAVNTVNENNPKPTTLLLAETRSTATPSFPPAPSPLTAPEELSWPGRFLAHPIPEEQLEEDHFYVRTEGGARFVSSMNIVNVVGPNGPANTIIEKEIAFSTGYRQDIDAGVWLTDWFGLAIETGFALNAIRGNTQGMTVSSSTYWSIPIMAQLCFQYPNDSGFLPYINFGFGGGWNYFTIGSINYSGPNFTTLSGSGNDMNTAYQIAAGVRYRLYDQLSLTLSYKFYGTSQPTVDMGDNQQVTFGSPVTNTIEIGGNFAF